MTILRSATSTTPAGRADIRFNGKTLTLAAGAGTTVPANYGVVIDTAGFVGIGTSAPYIGKLHVEGGGDSTAIFGRASYSGVEGYGGRYGVYGDGGTYGVYGKSTSGYAGYFQGKAKVTGKLEANGGLTVTGSCTGCSRVQSDQTMKANFSAINPRLVLNRLAALPIKAWNYKSDDSSVHHLGPMAQDFRAAFNLGADDKHIDMIDANGVTMAAVQGLYQMMQEKDAEIKQLRAQVSQQQVELNQVKRTIRRNRTTRKH